MLEQYGTVIGAILVGAVALCSVLLGRKANCGVAAFSEEEHQRFRGRNPTASPSE